MTSFQCQAKGCGKKFTSENFLKRHSEVMHKEEVLSAGEPKSKGWRTPYGFVDFKEPVTYAEALEVSELMNKRLRESHPHRFKDTTESKVDKIK